MPKAPASRPSSTRPASRSRAPPTASRSPPCPPPCSKTSTSAPPTAPRAGNSVVPANAGTHTPRPLEGALWQLPLLTRTPVVMGPCVRRDDDGIGADGSSSRTPSTRRPCERRDPYAAAFQLERCGARAFQQRTSVVIGPCVRRDDDGIGADGSSSRELPQP